LQASSGSTLLTLSFLSFCVDWRFQRLSFLVDATMKPQPSEYSLFCHPSQADAWLASPSASENNAAAAAVRANISNRPAAVWLGDWGDAQTLAHDVATASAQAQRALFQFVLYNIPDRDLGHFSAGGCASAPAYLNWVRGIATAVHNVAGARGIFVVEPDALAHAAGVGGERKAWRRDRARLVSEACRILSTRCPDSYIYVDASHPGWLATTAAADVLREVGVGGMLSVADGFALNVSNSCSTAECYSYGMDIIRQLGGNIGFVIDSSRNGAGLPKETGVNQWTNPPSLRIGHEGTTQYAKRHGLRDSLHALLWIKVPGESDGEHNGAPSAGTFWPEGARRLCDI
jgi:endoglucanase